MLIQAHQELESLTLAADVLRSKRQLEMQWSDLVYQGLWFGPLKEALDGFMDRTQEHVNGVVRLRLHKGNATVTGRGFLKKNFSFLDVSPLHDFLDQQRHYDK